MNAASPPTDCMNPANVPAAAHAALRLMHAPLLVLDRGLGLRYASAAACDLLGLAGDDLDRRWPQLLRELDLDGLAQLRPDGPPLRLARDPTLVDRACALRLEVHALADGEDAYLVLLKDRARIDERESQVIRASRLQALNFLSPTIVHDLSAPLNNIQLTLSLLDATVVGAKLEMEQDCAELVQRCQRYARVLKEETARMGRLVRELPAYLVSAREGVRERVDIGILVEEVGRLVRHEGTAKRIRRSFAIPPDPLPVRGEREGLKLALFNLAIALIEATRSGGSLSIEARQNGGHAEIDARAENCALDLGALEHMQSVSPGDEDGALGLLAARLLIEAHGGSIAARTDLPQGAGFLVTLPLAPVGD